MRSLVLAFVLASCVGRYQTTWTPVEPRAIDDGSDAFVLIGMNALHLSHVQIVDHHVRARVVHAWLLPPVGAAAIAAERGATPESIARGAGWQELAIADARIDVPTSAIRSARQTEPLIQDEPWNADDHPLVVAVVTSLLEVALVPASAARSR
jgi:hypothetical protein